MEEVVVRGIALDKDEAKITVRHVPNRPGVAAALFRELAAAGVNVDMIVQNIVTENDAHTDISFTVTADDLRRAQRVVKEHLDKVGGADVVMDEAVAKVSIVGVGMRSHAGIAEKMFSTLAEHQINIEMISTSEIKISVMIARSRADEALQLLHKAFALEQEQAG